MGVGETDKAPKKKLKQAQLNFCITTPSPKCANKRKLNADSPSDVGLASKVFRKDDTDTPRELDRGLLHGEILDDDGAIKRVSLLPHDGTMPPESAKEVIVLESSSDSVPNVLSVAKENSSDGKSDENTENSHADSAGQPRVDEITAELVRSKNGDLLKSSPPKNSVQISANKDSTGLSVDMVPDVGGVNRGFEQKLEEQFKQKNIQSTDAGSDKLCGPAMSGSANEPNTSLGSEGHTSLSSGDEQSPRTPPLKKRRTTPKSSSKKLERQRLQEEKLKLKKEREEQKRKEREEKERKRTGELRLKEEERKRKENERKKKEQERENERKRKEEERKKREEAKEEEKRKKEGEKRKKEELKEEDRRKREEVRLAEERKEQLTKQAFTKFFIPNKTKACSTKKDSADNSTDDSEVPKFMPFQVKGDMRLAVQVRRTLEDEDKGELNRLLDSGVLKENLFVGELKRGLRKPKSTPATWPLSEEQHDVIIVESVAEDKGDTDMKFNSTMRCRRQRAKLLQFHENRRPPYWGTWRKCSLSVTPRRPFGKETVLDYEVDSDSEWEDEEEGEDIDKEGESDKEQSDDEEVGENGYMLDNTFVPHGYLSDEEAAEEENFNPEDQKVKLKVLQQEFELEMRSKTERLKPRLLGCVWISNDTAEVSRGSLYESLMNYRCKWDEAEGPINVTCQPVVDCSPSPANPKFPSSMVEHLAKLVHGSHSSFKALIGEFLETFDKEKHLSSISKRAVYLKIKEISQKTHIGGRSVWVVNPEISNEYNLPAVGEPKCTSPAPVAPAPEATKSKESPLVSFLKKKSAPSRGPRKRVSTTLLPAVTQEKTGGTFIDLTEPEIVPTLPNQEAKASDAPLTKAPAMVLFTKDSQALESSLAKQAVGEPKCTPPAPVAPAPEATMSKESPLVSFLKKNSAPSREPRKRVSTTLLPPVTQEKTGGTFIDLTEPEIAQTLPNQEAKASDAPLTKAPAMVLFTTDSQALESSLAKQDSKQSSLTPNPSMMETDAKPTDSPRQASSPQIVKKRIATTYVGPLKKDSSLFPVSSNGGPKASTPTGVQNRVPLNVGLPKNAPAKSCSKLNKFFRPKPPVMDQENPGIPAEDNK